MFECNDWSAHAVLASFGEINNIVFFKKNYLGPISIQEIVVKKYKDPKYVKVSLRIALS